MWWFDHDDDNEDEMMPNHKQKVGWWMHILENYLRKETYILLVIQKQTFPSECRKILFKSECFGKVVLNSITVESFQVPTSDIILT